MTFEEKEKELRKCIYEALTPYIDRDYVFLDLPYHPNIGDTLISEAAKFFLKSFPYKCLYSCSEFTFDNRIISPKTLIIFNGGGNFGDLWLNYTLFRNKIIKLYPNNPFLILPQSACYNSTEQLQKDIKLYSKSPNITICARDKETYIFLRKHFTRNNILLVPDMVFYTDPVKLQYKKRSIGNRILFLKRKDKEFVPNFQYSLVPQRAEVHDWPTMETEKLPYYFYYKVWGRLKWRIEKCINRRLTYVLEDMLWAKLLHPYHVKCGIEFLNQYDIVYTTRLHVAILSVLLHKKVYLFDNSYHKNSALYHTWLEDLEGIKLID